MLLSYTGGSFFSSGVFVFIFPCFFLLFEVFISLFFVLCKKKCYFEIYMKKGLKEINLSSTLNAEFLFEGSKYFFKYGCFLIQIWEVVLKNKRIAVWNFELYLGTSANFSVYIYFICFLHIVLSKCLFCLDFYFKYSKQYMKCSFL